MAKSAKKYAMCDRSGKFIAATISDTKRGAFLKLDSIWAQSGGYFSWNDYLNYNVKELSEAELVLVRRGEYASSVFKSNY